MRDEMVAPQEPPVAAEPVTTALPEEYAARLAALNAEYADMRAGLLRALQSDPQAAPLQPGVCAVAGCDATEVRPHQHTPATGARAGVPLRIYYCDTHATSVIPYPTEEELAALPVWGMGAPRRDASGHIWQEMTEEEIAELGALEADLEASGRGGRDV